MNDSKMYHMSEDMECQYLTEDSKIRLYLSPVLYEKPGRREETIVEKITADVLSLFYSLAVTYAAGRWALESAYKCRGYNAIGGEYLLIIITAMGSFWLARKFLRHYRR